MTRIHSALLVACALVALPEEVLAQETYSWRNVELQVPAGWKVAHEADQGPRRMVRFESTVASPGVMVAIDINSEAPSTVDESYLERPGLVALGFLYPLLKGFAANPEGAGASVSFGEIMLGEAPAGAAHAVMPSQDGTRLATASGFVLHEGSVLIFGAVITGSRPGQVVEDPSHHRAIKEAYGLLRTLIVKTAP